MIAANQKPWVIYTRVSTDDQAREGVSLDAQKAACEAMALALGMTVREVVIDAGESGKSLNRPGISVVLQLVDAGELAGVLVYKLDRLTRNLRDLLDLVERFSKADTALHSVQDKLDTGSPNGRFFVSMLGAIAQWEREVIVERVTMGIRHRKAMGGFTGGRPPAGCRSVPAAGGGKKLEPDPATADTVRTAWKILIGGDSLRTVAEHLTTSGVPTSHGSKWSPQGARKLLINPRVIGVLIDQATHDKTLKTLAGRWAPAHRTGDVGAQVRQTDRAWLLAGIASCPLCGERLGGVTAINGSGKAFPYLRCAKRQKFGKSACAFKDQRAEPWESAVCQALVKSVQTDGQLVPTLLAFAAAQREASGPLADRLRELVMARDKIGGELANLGELASQGSSVAAGLARVIGERQERYAVAERAAAAAEGQLAAATMTADEAASLATIYTDRIATLPDLPPEDQARLLSETLDRAVLIPPEPGKTTGQVQFSLHLPRFDSTKFVGLGPMVERRTKGTNRPTWSVEVAGVGSLWRNYPFRDG